MMTEQENTHIDVFGKTRFIVEPDGTCFIESKKSDSE